MWLITVVVNAQSPLVNRAELKPFTNVMRESGVTDAMAVLPEEESK